VAEPQSLAGEVDLFRSAVQARVSPVNWQTWLAPLGVRQKDGSISITAPSEFHLRWVREKHLPVLEEAAEAAFGTPAELIFEIDITDPISPEVDFDVEEEAPRLGDSDDSSPVTDRDERRLQAKYTFENFVVGQSNRFAHAAAMAVAEQPGGHYNPLFIYGGAGLGKTHLLHAVGHHALELRPRAFVRYVSSENFFNEFIDGIRKKRMDEFKARYRTTDVLLLDDVQFFEQKEQILEEFFHTFNDLYESGKQMVISSDRHPKHLATLEDRLRSRFEWGLLTDIQPPDVETRIAILRKNAEYAPKPVSEEVLHFIAEHVQDNIRELEGALTRVTAYAALTDQSITMAMAQDVLQDLVPASSQRPVSPDDILAATAAAYGFSADDLRSPSRRQPLVLSRQVAMYLCREQTDLSLPKIGALFGGRDHTTVMHAIDKVKGLLLTDPKVFERVTALSQQLRKT
jgi:chromosomal replication initiator protein